MANIYVRSTDGSNTDNGTTWALAKLNLAGADAIDAAGDTIFVSDAHAETTAATVSLSFAGTAASPVRVICGDDIAQPPTAIATTATVSTTGASHITVTGHTYMYGITFQVADAANAASLYLAYGGSNTQTFEQCTFFLRTTSAGAAILASNAGTLMSRIFWKTCQVKFSAVAQVITIADAMVFWEGGSVAAGGTSPTNLFSGGANATGFVYVSGVDLSNCAAGLNIFTGNGFSGILRNCKLPASWTGSIYSGTPTPAGRYEMHNCDSGDTNYRIWIKDFAGELRDETTIVRTGGASDGTTTLAWKVTTTANCNFASGRFVTPELPARWNDTVGSAITVTVDVLHDSLTNLKDDEIWIEMMYLGTSGFPLGSVVSDAKADVLATAADQTASSAAWTTTGLTNPNKQKLSVTFTPQEKGYLQAKVMLGKASYTVYVDPKLQVS